MPTAEFQNICQSIRQELHCPSCGEIIRQVLGTSGRFTCPKCSISTELQHLTSTRGHLSFSKMLELSRLQVPWATMARWGDIHFDPSKFILRDTPQKYFDQFRTGVNSEDRWLFVLVGETGYGKTWLTASWAHNLVARKQPVFFCDLRDGVDQFSRIVLGCGKENIRATLKDVTGTLVQPIVWIFDGYDDCAIEADRTVIFEQFLQCNRDSPRRNRSHLLLLTSRPRDWLFDRVRFNHATKCSKMLWHNGDNIRFPASVTLAPFSPKEISLAAEKYHLPPPAMWSGALRALAQNPLWIAFASELFRPKKIMPDVVDPQLYLKFFARLCLQPTDLEALGDIAIHLLQMYASAESNDTLTWLEKIDRLKLAEIDFLTLSKLNSVGLISLTESESGSRIALSNPHHAWFGLAYRIYQLSKTDREEQLIPIYKQMAGLPDKESILHIAWALSVEIPEAPGVEDIPMVSYNGIALRAREHQVMVALEMLIGKPIPFLERVEWNTVGFSATSGHVRALNLSNQGLTALPPNFGDLTFLQRAWLAGNQLTELPVSFGNLRSLRKLNLVGNALKSLPNTLGDLQVLEKLSLGKNQLSTLPEQIGQIQTLEKFSINCNKLQHLPNSIGNLRNLKEIDLSHNQITELPEKIGNLQLLEFLDLSHNHLTKLQDTIGDLQTLKELYLSNNILTNLPESFGNLYLLQKLDLSHNKIQELHDSFGGLELLEVLDLECNELQVLPTFIENFELLKVCKLNDNKLEVLPETIGKLCSLQSLYLQHNCLSVLPAAIGNLGSLLELDLASNLLREIPQTIGNLHLLKVLVLSNNQLSTLPSIICDLNSLLFLYLDKNRLSHLPENFPCLQSLQYLDLQNNQFKVEPPCLQNMNLKNAIVEGNPI